MTQALPGWYPDPHGPAVPPRQRWWDGTRWTEHTVVHYSPAPAQALTTPDGELLASWERRLGAYVIDVLIVNVLTVLVGLPLIISIVHHYIDFFHEVADAPADNEPDFLDFYGPIWWKLAALALLGLAVQLAYHAVFLRWKQATPGKLMLGMRVRRREVAGSLPWSTILLRWVVQVLAALLPMFQWIDGLWPLWDANRQALHDKAAGTNVVLSRAP